MDQLQLAAMDEAWSQYIARRGWRDPQGNCRHCHLWRNHTADCPILRPHHITAYLRGQVV